MADRWLAHQATTLPIGCSCTSAPSSWNEYTSSQFRRASIMRRTWPQIARWPDEMRFLLDENVSGLAAERLRALGHDVRHGVHPPLAGLADTELFAIARDEERILVTRDHHFSNRARFPLDGMQGVVYPRPGNLTSEAEAQLTHATPCGTRPHPNRGKDHEGNAESCFHPLTGSRAATGTHSSAILRPRTHRTLRDFGPWKGYKP